ncbi:MAG: sensor histidine kinase [Rectinemataceae bacterium]
MSDAVSIQGRARRGHVGARKPGIRGYLIFLVALAIVAPFTVYFVLGIFVTHRFFERDFAARGEAVVQGVSESSLTFMRSAEIFVEAMATDEPLIKSRDPERLREYLHGELALNPNFESFAWINGRGVQLSSYPPDPNTDGLDLSDRGFAQPAVGVPLVSDSHISLPSGRPVVGIAVRLGLRGDTIVGSLDLSRLSDFVAHAGGPGWRISIVDRTGTIVADRDQRLVQERVNIGNVLPSGGRAGPMRIDMDNGRGNRQPVIAFTQPLQGYGWHVIASYDEEMFFGFLDRAVSLAVAVALAAFVVFAAVALLMARRILGDVEALRFGVRAIRDHRYGEAGLEPSFYEFLELIVDVRLMESAVEEREAQLAGMVRQRDTLLREVHHRVKNNMQIVSSLLSLQKDAIADSAASAALTDSVARVQALALMHEFLYRGADFANVDLGDYFRELCSFLFSAYGATGVDLVLAGDSVALDTDRAIPLGLVITEIVSNSLKYAFSGRDNGRVTLALTSSDGEIRIEAADDGPGFDPKGDERSLGLVLIDTLLAQLGGSVARSTDRGTVYRIALPRERG